MRTFSHARSAVHHLMPLHMARALCGERPHRQDAIVTNATPPDTETCQWCRESADDLTDFTRGVS